MNTNTTASTWIVIGCLFLAAALLTGVWGLARIYPTPVAPPGQFPIQEQPQVEWPATVLSTAYRPQNASGDQDSLEGTGVGRRIDPKRMCGRRLYEGIDVD